jgi:hypothetical protein
MSVAPFFQPATNTDIPKSQSLKCRSFPRVIWSYEDDPICKFDFNVVENFEIPYEEFVQHYGQKTRLKGLPRDSIEACIIADFSQNVFYLWKLPMAFGHCQEELTLKTLPVS